MLDLGLGYLRWSAARRHCRPASCSGFASPQVRSNLFGVVYVLDEPSAGLHPDDTKALLRAFDRLKAAGNSLFVVEHELDVVREADWIVDVGPGAGEKGGEVLYSGPPEGLRNIVASETRRHLFAESGLPPHALREPKGWLRLRDVTRNNLNRLDVDIPLGVMTSVTGISGSGKSTLVSQFLVEAVANKLGHPPPAGDFEEGLERTIVETIGGHIASGMDDVKSVWSWSIKPIGRTPRSNLATYTGLFDHVRKLFAETKMARARRYDAGRFPLTSPRAAARRCQGRASSASTCCFYRASMRRAPRVTAHVTTKKRST